MNRRAFLGGSVSGFFAYAMRNHAAPTLAKQPTGAAKRCVVLWMNGGPSQIDTFDPKPGTTSGGELQSIPTPVPGLAISETLPEVARRMEKLSVLRCLTSQEGEHIRGQYFLHTGYPFVPGFPRPAMGAVISHECPATDYPKYVAIGSRGFGPAYLGPDHAPFSIEEPEAARNLLRSIRQRKNRIRLLQDLGEDFDGGHPAAMLDRRRSMVSRIETMVSTPFVDSLNLEQEPLRVRNRYGDHAFGQACLLARRLLELGVHFVEIQRGGWDTHQNNFPEVRRLCESIDGPWAALLDDLDASGLLSETLVLWMGEFGRTPNINATRGRDHFPRVTPAVIGGGGIAGGRVVGKTSQSGTRIEGESYRVPDLFATVFHALGIAPDQEFETAFGSPTSATNDGTLITELL